jgi:uncharacterized coiled-coil protein SlyX
MTVSLDELEEHLVELRLGLAHQGRQLDRVVEELTAIRFRTEIFHQCLEEQHGHGTKPELAST